jgi:hypothetical protein
MAKQRVPSQAEKEKIKKLLKTVADGTPKFGCRPESGWNSVWRDLR